MERLLKQRQEGRISEFSCDCRIVEAEGRFITTDLARFCDTLAAL
jgi:hypothetical protein